MNDDERESFLAEANIAILGTVDSKNRPHAAPVWYLYENGEFIVSTGRGSQKHRNIERNPEVSLVIDSRVVPYYAVMIQGAAELGPGFSEEDRLRLATRYLGPDIGQRYVQMTQGEAAVTLRIRPRKVMVFNGRAGR